MARTKEMNQLTKCSQHKHEILRSDPLHPQVGASLKSQNDDPFGLPTSLSKFQV